MNRRDKKIEQRNDKHDNHHLINKCRGGSGVNENIRRTKEKLHTCLHSLYGNETPAEIMQSMFEYFYPSFSKAYQKEMTALLSKHYWKEHNPKCFKWNAIKDNWMKHLLDKWTV